MQKTAVILMLATVLAFTAHSSTALAKDGFEHYGTWTNVKVSSSADPHANGFDLKLWRYQGKILGYLSQYVGPPADPPLGPLEDIRLNEKTGQITFTARLSPGMVYSNETRKFVPATDVYTFRGVVKKDAITGTFTRRAGTLKRTTQEKVVLKGGRKKDDFWDGKTYQEWKDFYVPILKARGPK